MITFDTNIVLSATLWDGSVAQKLLFALIKRNVPIFTSMEILSEYQNVLKKDFGFSDGEIAESMENVLAFVTIVYPTLRIDAVKKDPKDNAILECALASHSQYLVTYDKHLLTLKEYQGVRIIRPEEARAMF